MSGSVILVVMLIGAALFASYVSSQMTAETPPPPHEEYKLFGMLVITLGICAVSFIVLRVLERRSRK